MVNIIITFIVCVTAIIIVRICRIDEQSEQKLKDIDKIINNFKDDYFTYNKDNGKPIYIGNNSVINLIKTINDIL